MRKLLIILAFLPLFAFNQTGLGTFNAGLWTFQGGLVTFNIPVYNDSAQALFNRFSQPADDDLKESISQWYDTIQYYNIDDSLDSRYVFALHNSTDALLDWFRPIYGTLVNSVSWVQYQGFIPNGTDSYIKTNYNPGVDAVNYKEQNNHIGVYIRTNNITDLHWLAGINDGTQNTSFRLSTTSYLLYNNSSTIWSFAHNGNVIGSNIMYRDGDAGLRFNKNGVLTTSGIATIGIPNQASGIYIGAFNNQGTAQRFDDNEYSIVNIGGGLLDIQAQKLYEADERLMDALDRGVNPLAASPYHSPDLNVYALQQGIANGDTTIDITLAGSYLFDDSIFLYDSTTINWGEGTSMEMSEAYNPVYINEGALTGIRNHNIEIDGLNLVTNEYIESDTLIWGMRGHLSFHTITDLRLNNIECTDLGTYNFFTHFANWENILIDGAVIAGNKDALHFHNGHDAIIRDVYNSSFDDLIFLGSTDFPYIQPDSIGDVYNMQFINVNDSNINGNSGFQTRVYLASWDDWTNGFTYNTGDMTLNVGNIYQVANPSSFSTTGTVAPTHTIGSVTGADGIRWKFKDTKTEYKANVYNISYDSCNYYKNRNYALSMEYLPSDPNVRNIYPGTEDSAKAYNFSYTNCSIAYENKTSFLNLGVVLQDLTIENNYFDSIANFMWTFGGAQANDSLVVYSDNNTWNVVENAFISSRTNNRKVFFESRNENPIETSFNTGADNGGILRAINYDIPLANLTNITPVLNDTCRDVTGQYYWNGASWILIP